MTIEDFRSYYGRLRIELVKYHDLAIQVTEDEPGDDVPQMETIQSVRNFLLSDNIESDKDRLIFLIAMINYLMVADDQFAFRFLEIYEGAKEHFSLGLAVEKLRNWTPSDED